MDIGALLSWFAVHRRDLPWRRPPHDRDPYARLVSEAMLQQTRVATVIDRFEAWLLRWPTPSSLADADEDEVLGAWAGLGYYDRARRLHRAAKQVAATGWPTKAGDLAALPGLGPYTAAAIASMAFDDPVPAVDGNVARVIIRHEALAADAADPAARRRVTTLLHDRIDSAQPGAWNEALIELGATVCTPRRPSCDACPLASSCQALATGQTAVLPLRAPRPRPVPVQVTAALVARDDRVLLRRRGAGLLAGSWGLPMWKTGDEAPAGVTVGAEMARVEHTFTHRHWRVHIHQGDAIAGAGTAGADAAWLHVSEAASRLHTRLDAKVLTAALAAGDLQQAAAGALK